MSKRVIRISFQEITPESAEDGDYSATGWVDEEGVDMDPDAGDLEDEEADMDDGNRDGMYDSMSQAEIKQFLTSRAAISKAVRFLQREGVSEASSYPTWQPGTWYSNAFDVKDYRTGTDRSESYHLDGFSEDEQRAIFERLKRSKAI